ncbi:Lsr2 family protein [Amycolatopsis mediterranei]|uniref:histone-like nucleoid-structuring protein Lsr2 n=1 Tax=Amycolatopsis mediterranei TaxID=33910 RepID=UPI003431FB19
MAKKVTIEISDDTDGSRADETVPFGLDGVAYEIDLSNANAKTLRAALTPFVTAARRTGGRRIKVAVGQETTANTKAKPQENDEYTAAHDIRSWARDHGYEVSNRGRNQRQSWMRTTHLALKTRPRRLRSPRTRPKAGRGSKRGK